MNNRHENVEAVLQTCLELIQSGQETIDSVLRRYPEHADELRMQLEAGLWLRSRRKAVDPSPEFIADSRRRLLSKIENIEARRPAGKPSPPFSSLANALQSLFTQKRFAYQAVFSILLVALLVISSTGVAFASQWAIPGDPLYPVKISMENTRLTLSFNELRRAELYIEFTQQRMVEIQSLVIENRTEYLHDTISRFEEQSVMAAQLLQSAGEANAPEVKALAGRLQQVLKDQAALFPVLVQVTSGDSRDEITRLMNITAAMTFETEVILTDGEVLFTPTPTQTLVSTATPLPPSSTPLSTSTLQPSSTPGSSVTPADTPLSTAPASAPMINTAAPTVVISGGQPSDTPAPAVAPKKTKKPHPTRRPHPSPKPKDDD